MREEWFAVALMTAVVLAGCSLDESDSEKPTPTVCPPPTYELTRSEQQMVTESNEFAFSLFRQAQDQLHSQVLSPISITFALGMLNNGAAGETQQQICQALGFGKAGVDSINTFCYKMLHRTAGLDPLTKVMLANTIYVNQPYELKPEFVTLAKAIYGAEPESRNFGDGKTMDVINKWASDRTEGMIDKVLDEQTFDPSAVSYLLNAIYFKGTWTWKFDKVLTKEERFDHAGDAAVLTLLPMMHMQKLLPYAENENYQAVILPYGNASYWMTVLLPKEVCYNEVPQVPSAQEWEQLFQKERIEIVDLKLPRFEMKTDTDLARIMKVLGVKNAFTEAAEFPDFCNLPAFIGKMMQLARIEVDEEGTDAASLTVIEDYCRTTPPTTPTPAPTNVTFHANHPFLYVISERTTGAVLFIGQFTGQ